ncbi:MAG: acyltransferase [Lachnospiraceae bacterium]|nr:acyltransferase [Lachnospiraceae bacterium]
MSLKYRIKKLIYGERASSKDYIEYLKKKGVKIGERTTIFNPMDTFIDEQYPWMIEIGNDVQITRGVTILTHGFDWSVLKHKYNHLLGSSGKVIIKDNVFIGMNATILKNITVGENSIIGVGAVVTKDVPANSVVAGNPAKVMCTIEEYYNKYTMRQKDEAVQLAIGYYERYGKMPKEDIFYDYYWLWTKKIDDFSNLPSRYKSEMETTGNIKACLSNITNTNKEFEDFNSFIEFVKEYRGLKIKEQTDIR